MTAVIAAFTLATTATAEAPRGDQSWQWKYRVWMPAHWIRLAECESGSKPPNWRHDSGSYSGAFGFADGSWTQFRLPGYPTRASWATPFQQFQVARRIGARYGLAEPWGCWRNAEHAWVRGGLSEYGTYR